MRGVYPSHDTLLTISAPSRVASSKSTTSPLSAKAARWIGAIWPPMGWTFPNKSTSSMTGLNRSGEAPSFRRARAVLELPFEQATCSSVHPLNFHFGSRHCRIRSVWRFTRNRSTFPKRTFHFRAAVSSSPVPFHARTHRRSDLSNFDRSERCAARSRLFVVASSAYNVPR